MLRRIFLYYSSMDLFIDITEQVYSRIYHDHSCNIFQAMGELKERSGADGIIRTDYRDIEHGEAQAASIARKMKESTEK